MRPPNRRTVINIKGYRPTAARLNPGLISNIAGSVIAYAKAVLAKLSRAKPSNRRTFSTSLVARLITSPLPIPCTKLGSCSNTWSKMRCLRSASTWRPIPNTRTREANRTSPITVARARIRAASTSSSCWLKPSLRLSMIRRTKRGNAVLRRLTTTNATTPRVTSRRWGPR